jgi:hypothetical protein
LPLEHLYIFENLLIHIYIDNFNQVAKVGKEIDFIANFLFTQFAYFNAGKKTKIIQIVDNFFPLKNCFCLSLPPENSENNEYRISISGYRHQNA